MFTLDTEIRESDIFSESVLVKMRKNFKSGASLTPDELYLTVDQFEQLGLFMLRRAAEIKEEQQKRNGG